MTRLHRRRGVAIIVVLLVLMILATIGLAIATLGANNLVQASSEMDGHLAAYAAEAGARRKVGELQGGDTANIPPNTSLPRISECTYGVTVTQGGSTAPNGVVVPGGADTYYVLSTGISPRKLRRKVAILLKRTSSPFSFAAFAGTSMQIKGISLTDTYNSSTGLPGNHALATIGTNSAAAGAISFDSALPRIGGPTALARVMGPPGSTEAVTVSGSAGQYASYQMMGSQRTFPPIVSPRSSTGSPAKAELGAVLRLTPGDYEVVTAETGGALVLDVSALPDGSEANFCFKSFSMLDPLSRLELDTGGKNIKCNLYVDGGSFVVKNGSIVNPTSRPELLQFKISNGNAKVENSGAAYFVAYAPNHEFAVKQAQVFGSITADKILLENGLIHYDETLASVAAGGFGNVEILSVQRF